MRQVKNQLFLHRQVYMVARRACASALLSKNTYINLDVMESMERARITYLNESSPVNIWYRARKAKALDLVMINQHVTSLHHVITTSLQQILPFQSTE